MPAVRSDLSTALVEARTRLDQASVRAHVPQLREAAATLEEIVRSEPRAGWAHYHLGYAHHRISLLRLDVRAEAVEHLTAATQRLREAVRLLPESGDPPALLSGCYGLQIRYAPLKAIWLGDRKGRLIAQAEQLEPHNPRVILARALQRWATPRFAGGDRHEALAGFARAVERFESWTESEPLGPRWGHAQALAYLGMALTEAGQEEAARDALRSALRVEPEYHWVKHALLPKAGGMAA